MNNRTTDTVFNLAVAQDPRAAQPGSATVASRGNQVFYSVALLLIIVGALLVYKGTAALAVIDKVQNAGAFHARVNVVPIPGDSTQFNVAARSINYFAIIWPALLFGILISAAVRVLDPPRWLGRGLGYGPIRSHPGWRIGRGTVDALLMLCSTCIFRSVRKVVSTRTICGPYVGCALAESRSAHTYVHVV